VYKSHGFIVGQRCMLFQPSPGQRYRRKHILCACFRPLLNVKATR